VAEVDTRVRDAAARLVAKVRARLRDYPALNRLTKGEETSDRFIALELWNTISDWNATPPPIPNASVVDFPYEAALIDGTVGRVLESVALLGGRNAMSYSDGRVSVNGAAKSGTALQQASYFIQKYERVRDRAKPAINIANALGSAGVGSDYSYINFVDYF
jgi:hypothetical protein